MTNLRREVKHSQRASEKSNELELCYNCKSHINTQEKVEKVACILDIRRFPISEIFQKQYIVT